MSQVQFLSLFTVHFDHLDLTIELVINISVWVLGCLMYINRIELSLRLFKFLIYFQTSPYKKVPHKVFISVLFSSWLLSFALSLYFPPGMLKTVADLSIKATAIKEESA